MEKEKKMGKNKVIIILGIVLVMIIFVIVGISRAFSGSSTKETGTPVQYSVAKKENVVTKVSVKGNIDFVSKETIFPTTTAKIGVINVKEGDQITKGQVIFSYDEKSYQDLQDRLKDAQLSLKTAQVNLKGASLPSTEAEVLSSQASITQAEKTVNDVESQIIQNELSLASFERNYETAKENEKISIETYNSNKILFDSGIISKDDLDRSKQAMDLAIDNTIKAKDSITNSTNQKSSLEKALGSAKTSLEVANKQSSTVKNKSSDARVQNQKETAQITVEQATRNVEKVQKEVNEFKKQEVATFGGTIVSLPIVEGQSVNSSVLVCVIADTSVKNLVITANVPEIQSKDVALDQPVTVKGGALGYEKYEGKVTKISPIATSKIVGSNSQTVVPVQITIDDQSAKLKSGYTVDTEIITSNVENALVIPAMSTLPSDDGQNIIYVVKEDNTLEKRVVYITAYAGTNVTVNNLAEGEKIVVNPNPNLKEGEKVTATEIVSKNADEKTEAVENNSK